MRARRPLPAARRAAVHLALAGVRSAVALTLALALAACREQRASEPPPVAKTAPTTAVSKTSPEGEDEDEPVALAPDGGAIDEVCRFSKPQCATERWGVKIGIDPKASLVHRAAHDPTIAELRSEPVPGAIELCTPRYPSETELVELHDVRLVCFKWEKRKKGDHDFHLVLEDPTDPVVAPADDPHCHWLDPKNGDISKLHTIIVEIPDPDCLDTSNPWHAAVAAARAAFTREWQPSGKGKATRVDAIVSVRGVRFFDVVHGQLGVVQKNGVELHPVLGFCEGPGCALP